MLLEFFVEVTWRHFVAPMVDQKYCGAFIMTQKINLWMPFSIVKYEGNIFTKTLNKHHRRIQKWCIGDIEYLWEIVKVFHIKWCPYPDFDMFHVFCEPWNSPLLQKFAQPTSTSPQPGDVIFGLGKIRDVVDIVLAL